MFYDPTSWIKLDAQYYTNLIMMLIQLSVAGIFIRFVWKKMPVENKVKTNSTLMIIFLGTLGMWLWLPNKREFSKLEDKQKSS